MTEGAGAHRGFPFEFRCHRTGNCCARPGGVVAVTPGDVQRMAAHLGMDEAAFRSRFVAVDGRRLVESPDSRCVFLEDGREATTGSCSASCRVYPVRPERCRSWPYWTELREDREALSTAMRFCPGIQPLGGLGAAVRDRDASDDPLDRAEIRRGRSNRTSKRRREA